MPRPRGWPQSILLTLATVYVPLAVPFVVGPFVVWPFVVGPLTECGHCVASHLRMAPILPGAAIGLLFTRSDLLFFVAAGAVTLTLIGGGLGAARRLPTAALLAIAAWLVPLFGLQAYAVGILLRA